MLTVKSQAYDYFCVRANPMAKSESKNAFKKSLVILIYLLRLISMNQ